LFILYKGMPEEIFGIRNFYQLLGQRIQPAKIFLIVVTNIKYTRQEWQPLTFPLDISRNSLQVTEIHTRSK
jgi:hypothetical protein